MTPTTQTLYMIQCSMREYTIRVLGVVTLPKTKKGTKKEEKQKKKSIEKKTTPTKNAGKKESTKKKAVPSKTTAKTTKAPSKKRETKTKRPVKKKTSSVKNNEILKELEIELASDDEQVCLGAVDRLGKMKDSKATEILLRGLKDPRHMVRIQVAAQLGERKDRKAVDALIESLHDDSVFVRQTAAGSLENIGVAKGKKAVAQAEKEGILLDTLPEGRRLSD